MNLSVRTKILSAFLVVFGLFLGVLGYGLLTMRQVSTQLIDLQQRYVRLTKVVSRMELQQTMLEHYDLDRLFRDRQRMSSVTTGVLAYHANEISESIQECQSLLDSAANDAIFADPRPVVSLQRSLTALADAYFGYDAAMKLMLAAAQEDNVERARELAGQQRTRALEVGKAIKGFSARLDESIGEAMQVARSSLERAQLAGGGLTAVSVVLGLSMMFLSNRVLRPISRLTEGVKRVSEGAYDSRVEIPSEDEIGVLAREFNAMASTLEEREGRLGRQRRELEQAYAALQRTNADLRALSLYNANILNSISVGLLAGDRAGLLTTANPRARAILGLSDEDLGTLSIAELPGLELGPVVRRVLESGRTVRRDGVPLRGAEPPGEAATLLDCTAVPLTADDGAVEGVILLVEDVTERTAIRQRLLLSERLALIGKMSAQVTHEIRNPLNALGLNAELLEEELSDLEPEKVAEARTLLASISREIDRLTEITEQYLSLARLPRPRLAREDVGGIVSSLASFMAEEAARREIGLTVEVEAELPPILLDESQLRQALLNIIRNSLDASASGGEVSIKAARRGGGVEIAVTDRGPGMDPAQLGRIFDPFYSTKQRGTGLGLPITQQIIEEHRGRITCESQEGEGTTFRIWLPAGVDSLPAQVA